ncbi:2-phosphosulfolactate phosphatase [Jeotgalibacillus campisalis]|uniref:Probable 2-phosphosulfolactate phosphatase n=1 Tax=Jeotgalibacillus campisalis TaxID=220754 RepID=A0A0C2RS35_9BACL|nr:2-phosphosulfolactate phosphatase [Jeotgalibacillus campisalis]KIL53040.1 2-phosphosulfolactate phosphatase [Jeotgalibacillus campisalis]
MIKVHVLFTKEELIKEQLQEGNKTAVVIDVLLATTTITTALMDGAKAVLPVLNGEEGKKLAAAFQKEDVVLAGEMHAEPIEGFVYPSPSHLRTKVNGKTLILSTTNGTVALRNAAGAKRVYIACLLNNKAVAQAVLHNGNTQTILIVCAGNSGEVSLEDLYGAGHFIDCLTEETTADDIELTDSSQAVRQLYRGHSEEAHMILSISKVGRLFARYDVLEELEYASRKNSTPLVPIFRESQIKVSNEREDL